MFLCLYSLIYYLNLKLQLLLLSVRHACTFAISYRMRLHMQPQLFILEELLRTHQAFESLLVSAMRPAMAPSIARIPKHFVAHFARITRSVLVHPEDVIFQSMFRFKIVVALIATERFLFGMTETMVIQMTQSLKGLAANFANVFQLIRVRRQMHLKNRNA